jgi:hypothetical protein
MPRLRRLCHASAGRDVEDLVEVTAGVHATLVDLAKAKAINTTYVSRVLRLTLLAPEFVEAILDGRQPAELKLDDLLEGFTLEWEGQCRTIGEVLD